MHMSINHHSGARRYQLVPKWISWIPHITSLCNSNPHLFLLINVDCPAVTCHGHSFCGPLVHRGLGAAIAHSSMEPFLCLLKRLFSLRASHSSLEEFIVVGSVKSPVCRWEGGKANPAPVPDSQIHGLFLLGPSIVSTFLIQYKHYVLKDGSLLLQSTASELKLQLCLKMFQQCLWDIYSDYHQMIVQCRNKGAIPHSRIELISIKRLFVHHPPPPPTSPKRRLSQHALRLVASTWYGVW